MGSEKASPGQSQNWEQLWDFFHKAREADPVLRAAYLNEIEQDNPELFHKINDLLAADEHSGEMLEDLVAREIDSLEMEPEPGSLRPDEVLAARFRILRHLGQGGMGSVYEAFDEELGTTVALKIMRSDWALDLSARERFHREINLARQVTHPNTCRIFDLFHHEDLLFLTMELLNGITLHEKVRLEGPLSSTDAMPIVLQVSQALSAIHHLGIVHRDLKGSNIMLLPRDDGFRVVVTDFGLATTLPGRGSLHVTETGQVLGTPEFMAPEQLTKGRVTPATDVYALGLVMYEMVTGKIPLEGESPLTIAARRISEDVPSPKSLVPDLNRKWERVILRCLERKPEHRFQDAAEVAAALKGESLIARLPVFPLRHRTRLISGIFVLLIGLLLGLPFLWNRQHRTSGKSDVIAKRLWSTGTGLPPGLLSTDGKILIDVDWQSADLLAIDLETREKRRLTNSGVWFVPYDFSPYPGTTALSPDGKQVAYSIQHVWEPGTDLRIVSTAGSAARTIYSDRLINCNPADWSPDGNQILVLLTRPDGTTQMALVSVRDSSLRILKSLESNTVRKMGFSPNGRYIIYDLPQEKGSDNHDLFLFSLDNNSETRLVANPANEYLIGWFPGGDQIVFASDRSGTHDAWSLRMKNGKPLGAPVRTRKDIGQIYPLKLTRDGSLYYQHLMTSRDVVIVKEEDGIWTAAKLEIGVSGANTGPEFSPDGKSLIFQTLTKPVETRWAYSPPSMFKILSLETNQQRDLFPKLQMSALHTRWSPDGQSILIDGNDGVNGQAVYQIDINSGNSKSIIGDPKNNWIRQYNWSPDGSAVFYELNKEGKIWKKDLSTGKVQQIYSGSAEFNVSRDGRLAVISVDIYKGSTSLRILSSNYRESREILKLQMPEWIPHIAWTPDSKHLIFAKGRRDDIDQPHRLWRIPVQGGKAADLGIETEYVNDLRIHPDGHRIAIPTLIDTSEVWVLQNFLPPDNATLSD